MSNTLLAIGVTLKAYDNLTAGFRNASTAVGKFNGVLGKAAQSAAYFNDRFGRGLLANGLIVAGSMGKVTSAFSELETASSRLRVTLMDASGGVPAVFERINAQAIALGNRLPGTTADFYNMAAALNALGVSSDAIAGGVLQAAAELGVVLKPLGVTYEQTAESVAKFKESLGIAEGDMVAFADTVQRLAFSGAKLDEMRLTFSKLGATLQTLKIQGLSAANELAPLVAMLLRAGLTGETAGTGLKNVLNALSDPVKMRGITAMLKGVGIQFNTLNAEQRFIGITGMIGELEKLQKLDPRKFSVVIQKLFGTGEDAEIAKTIISKGTAGYQKVVEEMERQAALNRRVDESLTTLANLWEALTGTFSNLLAAFGETFAPELKAITKWLNELAEGAMIFTKEHPRLAKTIGLMVVGFAAAAITVGALGLAWAGFLRYLALIGPVIGMLKGLATAIRLVSVAIAANPIGAALLAFATVAYLVIENWETLKAWFMEFIDWLGKKLDNLTELIPEWMRNLFSGKTPFPALATTGPGPSLATGGIMNARVGGKIQMEITAGRGLNARVTGLSTVNRDVPIDMDTGPAMVAP